MLGFYLALLDTAEDKSRFEELYLTYRQDMYKTAFAILRSPQSAEDAVHEAFMIVIGKLNKISEINCPQTRAYLIIIVKNLALKMYNEVKKLSLKILMRLRYLTAPILKPILFQSSVRKSLKSCF